MTCSHCGAWSPRRVVTATWPGRPCDCTTSPPPPQSARWGGAEPPRAVGPSQTPQSCGGAKAWPGFAPPSALGRRAGPSGRLRARRAREGGPSALSGGGAAGDVSEEAVARVDGGARRHAHLPRAKDVISAACIVHWQLDDTVSAACIFNPCACGWWRLSTCPPATEEGGGLVCRFMVYGLGFRVSGLGFSLAPRGRCQPPAPPDLTSRTRMPALVPEESESDCAACLQQHRHGLSRGVQGNPFLNSTTPSLIVHPAPAHL